MISDFINIKSSTGFLKWLVIFLLVLFINVFVVRFLWNTVLVKHITVLRPVQSLLDTLLLAIALTMFHGNCMKGGE
jgi:hypothetical protein